MTTKHNYALEIDVIEAAGVEAIQRLAEKGNTVYVPFEELERRIALKEKERYSFQFAATLDFITENGKINLSKKEYTMPSGGKVKWDPNSELGQVIHLTRNSAIKSKLKREGKKYEEPKFLKYGADTLKEGFLTLESNLDFDKLSLERLIDEQGREFANNTVVNLISLAQPSQSLVFKVEYPLTSNFDGSRFEIDESNGKLVMIDPSQTHSTFSQFKLRNLEQKVAYSLMTDKNIELIIVSGGSGSGKTILSYIAAVEQILGTEKLRNEKERYGGIILFKSNDIIGGKVREQGFLPGSAYEKVKPFMRSYVDAHKLSGLQSQIPFKEMLADPTDPEGEFGIRKKSKFNDSLHLPARNSAIEIEHLQYARGRTFEDSLIIADEVQNDTPFEIKQLIERVGINSKIILIGDPEQIDNPVLTRDYNGLVYAANVNYNTHPRYASIYLGKNYRSQSAEIMKARVAPRE